MQCWNVELHSTKVQLDESGFCNMLPCTFFYREQGRIGLGITIFSLVTQPNPIRTASGANCWLFGFTPARDPGLQSFL